MKNAHAQAYSSLICMSQMSSAVSRALLQVRDEFIKPQLLELIGRDATLKPAAAALCALLPGSRRSLAVRAADFRHPVCRLVPIFSELNHGAQFMFFTLPL